jgi:hypothetical protein
MIPQIPPNQAENPSPGRRLGLKERAPDLVRDQIPEVVLGCHYTNTPNAAKEHVTAIIDGNEIRLAGSNAVLRVGDGDR